LLLSSPPALAFCSCISFFACLTLNIESRSSPRSHLASRSSPRSNLSFRVALLSPISCILPHCCNPAARNNFFSCHLVYLRTTHYFIHLNSSRSFLILLLSSHLALAFCSCISLSCCNHATRNNFCSYRLVHLRTTHSLYLNKSSSASPNAIFCFTDRYEYGAYAAVRGAGTQRTSTDIQKRRG
jgi:hypothetical protein